MGTTKGKKEFSSVILFKSTPQEVLSLGSKT